MKKKNSFGILERFPTKCTNYFFHFLFRFLLKTEKKEALPLCPPFCPPFLGGSSAASPLKIWDAMPPYLKSFLSKKQKFDNFDHFRRDDPLKWVFKKKKHFLSVFFWGPIFFRIKNMFFSKKTNVFFSNCITRCNLVTCSKKTWED